MNPLLNELTALLGASNVLTGADIAEKYQADWSGDAPQPPLAVVRPASTEEVAQVLKCCHRAGQALSVQGGMTGLSGGATPQAREVAMSLERMSGIEEIDEATMTMTLRAGTPLQVVQEAAAEAGFAFPLDLGARGSCQIGGNVSTNAGGNQVIRYGATRALVLGLEAVLPDGTIISAMNKLLKNNSGYDLKQLFIGTEGTLGVVTRVVLRLFPQPVSVCTALCALGSFDDTLRLLRSTTQSFAGTLNSFEVLWANYFDYIVDHALNISSPFDQRFPIYVLLEIRGSDAERDQRHFDTALAAMLEAGLLKDAVIAQSQKEANAFWAIRDGIAEAMPMLRPTANFDIGIPAGVMEGFLQRIERELRGRFPDIRTMMFGHIGDGNLHYIATTGKQADVHTIYDVVYAATGDFHGAVSAEHGIGTQKREYLPYSRSSAEIELMQRLKSALDPKGILNGGRII